MKEYLHFSDDYKKYWGIYILVLSFLIIDGIYKNGYLVYERNLIDFSLIFKSLYLIIISFIIYMIYELIFFRKITFNFQYIYLIILCIFMMPNINIVYFGFGLFSGLIINYYLKKKFRFNEICFLILWIFFLCFIFKNYGFLNNIEKSLKFSYSFSDYFFGKQSGGICASNLFLAIIIYIVLATQKAYKRIIPLLCYSCYFSLMLFVMFCKNTFNYELLFNAHIFLGFVLVVSENYTTPYKINGQVIYSILIGIFTFLMTFLIDQYVSVFISSLFFSMFCKYFDKIKIKNLAFRRKKEYNTKLIEG
ncbi:MAG: hypothetical protein E7172_03765 [Firmicutes bacterium]|nr:hypothetical protein [Bacillota bacterium]